MEDVLLGDRLVVEQYATAVGHGYAVDGAGGFFDEKHPRYVKAWKSAVDKLVKYNIPFEANLGGLERKHTVEPYPSLDIIKYIKQKGGKIILTSDSHWVDMIGSHFEEYKYLLEE